MLIEPILVYLMMEMEDSFRPKPTYRKLLKISSNLFVSNVRPSKDRRSGMLPLRIR